MPTLPLRSRDDVLFGGKRSKRDPPAPPEVKAAIDSFDSSEASADECKGIGNMCYQNEMYSAAIQYYSKAIDKCPDSAVHFSNRSAAYLNSSLLAGPSLALKDANRAIEIQPTWFKGYVRKADALFVQEKLEAAAAAYEEALGHNKLCTIAVDSLAECRERMSQGKSSAKSTPGGIPSPPPTRKDMPPAPPSIPTSLEDGRIRDEPVKVQNPNVPTPEETDTKIASWSSDTTVDLGATATRRYKASVAEADRELGRTIKEQMMGKYRTKLSSDERKREEVLKGREEEQLRGSAFDYKRSSVDGNRAKVYSRGTDDVGNAISADCYQSYTSKDKGW